MSEKLGTPTNVSVDSPNVVCDVVTNADTYAFVVDSTEIGEYDVNVANISYSTSYATAPSPIYTLTLSADDLPTLTDSAHSFDGWYYDDAFTNKANVGDTIEGNITLFAKWGMNHTYTETMGANTIDIRTNKEVIDITYNGSTIATMDVAKKTLKTKDKLVEHPITFGEFSLDKSGHIFADDIVIDRTDELKSPILNVDGETLYITDRNESATEGVRIYVDGVYSKTIYNPANATVSNLGAQNPSDVVFTKSGNFPDSFEEVTDANGNIFVKFPTMYRKVNTVVDGQITSFTISTAKEDDSYFPYPVFVEPNGNVMPYVLIGKYIFNKDGVAEGKAQSIPVDFVTEAHVYIDVARTMARQVGEGYQQFDWKFKSFFTDLCMMVYETVNIYGKEIPLPLGVVGCYSWVDGVASYNGKWIFADNESDYVNQPTGSTQGYTVSSFNNAATSYPRGNVKSLGYDENYPFFNFPKEKIEGSSYATYYSSNIEAYTDSTNRPIYWRFADERTVKDNGYGGLWSLDVFSSWTTKYEARLCYRPISTGGNT